MTYTIRAYRDDDAEALSGINAAAIERIGPHAYTDAQVAAWRARHPGAKRYRERVASGACIFVAVDRNDTPVAYTLLESDGHLDHLYNHPAHTRRGLAARLLKAAEDHARTCGLKRLYTEASDLARPVFEHAGYAVLGKREFTIAHEGRDVPIHNWAMEKRLK